LFILIVVNSITLISLALLLSNALWSLAWNMSTIEAWELDRHEALLRRARVSGGYLDGPDGMKIRIKRQEYPYDIGIWQNFKQGMGSGNVCLTIVLQPTQF
jgi:palmitoyltransferase